MTTTDYGPAPPEDWAPQGGNPGSTTHIDPSDSTAPQCPKGCPWRGSCPVHHIQHPRSAKRPELWRAPQFQLPPRGYRDCERMMRRRHETPQLPLTREQKRALGLARALRQRRAREAD